MTTIRKRTATVTSQIPNHYFLILTRSRYQRLGYACNANELLYADIHLHINYGYSY